MNTSLRITCLVDDCAHQMGLLAEHGLSFLVEMEESRFLLDTGSTDVLLRTAEAMSIHLAGLDGVILSHGHYDHTGGLPGLLRRVGATRVYCHPDACKEKLVVREGSKKEIYAGPNWKAEELAPLGAEFECSCEPRTIAPGMRITGQIPRVHPEEPVPAMFQRRTEAGLKPDDLPDDQCLVVDTPKGLVVVLACTHAGIINTLDYIDTLSGGQPIRAMVGGLHLVDAKPERIRWTISHLEKRNLELIGLCHCTGLDAFCAMRQAFPDRVQYIPTGTVLNFD
ncbi:MAG TPA: MBL fold metallo-hydrolase [bacterium]|nr:MBL fold metallo-hydrolase [bacterium]HPO07230.1 MBL fold metallo-hydrolase [bacterium]HQO35515.1 MBL fold metallo-hydrolase [bacterium]HQP99988.1 MBL fold metallo-hydrolase [bacterium]